MMDTNNKARMCVVPSMKLRQLLPSQVCAYFVSSITAECGTKAV
jgi:hypothetical protein